jgi:adenosylcobinamide-phosphate synthase
VNGGDVARGVGLIAGLALDSIVRDPARHHPVAAFGTAATRLERHLWRDSRLWGAAFTAVCVGTVVGAGAVVQRRTTRPRSIALVTAATTWTVLGGASLRREAGAVGALLRDGELPAARDRLTHLVGRDPSQLDAAAITRAVVESVAENTSDAVVAPLFWGAVAGVPGLLGYRAINTLDAMVGHRSERYLHFGWAAARLDDLANWVPARLTAGLTVLLASVVDGSSRRALTTCWRDGGKHPSPNAGPVEAAFAGALGRTLGGRLSYGTRVEERPLLGDGPAPLVADIPRAARLSAAVALAAGVLAAAARR